MLGNIINPIIFKMALAKILLAVLLVVSHSQTSDDDYV